MNLRILVPGLGLGIVSCQLESPDLKQLLDGWEYVTTFQVLPERTISVVDKEAKLLARNGDVVIVDVERKPIFKPGRETTDLHFRCSQRNVRLRLTGNGQGDGYA